MLENSKVALVAIAMIATGGLVLPQTVSLFAGQHNWYNIDDSGNQIPCQKCHADVFNELDQNNFHVNFSGGTKGEADVHDCAACHRSNESITYASGDAGYTPGNQAHAASVVACMMCHEYNASADGNEGYYAGGFAAMDDTNFNYTTGSATNGTWAAHNAFVQNAINDSTETDSNEACLACHTHTAVKINWTHASSLEFNSTLRCL